MDEYRLRDTSTTDEHRYFLQCNSQQGRNGASQVRKSSDKRRRGSKRISDRSYQSEDMFGQDIGRHTDDIA